MFKKILIGITVIILVFLLVVGVQPAAFHITRSTTIAAPADVVFAQVNDFHKWDAWSPWAKLDPAMKQTYEGAPTGVGAVYSWVGNKDVGEGRMTITESRPSELVGIKLEFLKPIAQVNDTQFALKPDGNQTAVTWTMIGTNDFMAKAFGLFVNLDKMVGGDFEKGLAQMKLVAEAAAKK